MYRFAIAGSMTTCLLGVILVAAWPAATATLAAAASPARLPANIDPLVRNIDPSVKPGDDFFRYATGAWTKNHPIPASERGWSIAHEVEEEIYRQLRAICETAAVGGAPRGSDDQKVGDFWVAAMDSVGIEKQGMAPLRPELDRIDAIRSRQDLLQTMAYFQTIGVRPVYSLWVGQDDKNSAAYVVFLHQGGIGLPDRDYYFLSDSMTKSIRQAYPGQIAAMLRLLGDNPEAAERAAQATMEIEMDLARASRTIEKLRDPYANYNKMSMGQLAQLTPSIDWKEQFQIMGIAAVDSVVVGQPEFYAKADSALASVPIEAWKDYLRWSLVNTYASCLSRAFDDQNFAFYGTLLSGTKVQRPRWKRMLDAEEGSIGELLGKVWVRKYCSPATKARYERLVDDIFSAYRDRIRQLDWMSTSTKEKAQAKLDRVTKKVGYPDHWRDLSTLEVDRTSFARNEVRVFQWWFHYRADKLGHPVDRTEWDMTPQTYNAYYNGSNVEIVLPAAAFLIPGVPDSLIDDAVLYSYAGASTIGHEITHGFDDEGRQYDAEGNMKPWWTSQDSVRFAERTKVLADQFDQYVVGARHVRGFATLGENIADLGGLVIAYDGFKKTEQWKKGEQLNGFTPDQRFFLGYALAWLGQERPEFLDQLIMTDVHSPRTLRVNGPLSDMPEFYAAFGVKPGDPMYRPDSLRVRIW
jgi:putative endopeptidase